MFKERKLAMNKQFHYTAVRVVSQVPCPNPRQPLPSKVQSGCDSIEFALDGAEQIRPNAVAM